jgi:hypothetical protein
MAAPAFTAQASLYRTRNHYRRATFDGEPAPANRPVSAAYIPGSQTMEACEDCLHNYVVLRDICLVKTAVMVAEGCIGSLGFGCGAAIALGYQQAAACEEGYAIGFGLCHIPGAPSRYTGKCCPKVCGAPTQLSAGSGCCDLGETCKGLGMRDNTRDGCCPVGRDCGEVCCAPGEKCCGEICCPANYYCLDSRTCSENPGTFANTTPPPLPQSDCEFFAGGSRCGNKCCYGGMQCCGVEKDGQPICKTSCGR